MNCKNCFRKQEIIPIKKINVYVLKKFFKTVAKNGRTGNKLHKCEEIQKEKNILHHSYHIVDSLIWLHRLQYMEEHQGSNCRQGKVNILYIHVIKSLMKLQGE